MSDIRGKRPKVLGDRVAGLRLTVAFGVSSLAVWLLGPIVKAAGFATLLLSMAGIAALTLVAITWLPSHARTAAAMMPIAPEAPPQSPRAAD